MAKIFLFFLKLLVNIGVDKYVQWYENDLTGIGTEQVKQIHINFDETRMPKMSCFSLPSNFYC